MKSVFVPFLLLQVEPFYVTLSLFDIQNGRKISSDFHVDLNHPSVRAMVPNNTSQYMNGGGDTHPEEQRLVHSVPEAALKYPRQVSRVKKRKKIQNKLKSCFKKVERKVYSHASCSVNLYCRQQCFEQNANINMLAMTMITCSCIAGMA